jgi:hypothetical protein
MRDFNELKQFLKHVDQVHCDIAAQIERKCDFANVIVANPDLKNYDLNQMLPKVSYDDWAVCWYKADDKFYLIAEDSIVEVIPVFAFEYHTNFTAVDDEGNVIDDDDLIDYYPADYCGETDDMQGYVYFDLVE